jgi:hypothetical protein
MLCSQQLSSRCVGSRPNEHARTDQVITDAGRSRVHCSSGETSSRLQGYYMWSRISISQAEARMRRTITILFIVALCCPSFCKDKKKQLFPDAVLNATSVFVTIEAGAGASVLNPGEQNTARAAVEQALQKWGRFRVQSYSAQTDRPDLIIEIRKGGDAKTVIHTGQVNQRPAVEIGELGGNVSLGRRAPASKPSIPNLASEYSTDDLFTVYLTANKSKIFVWRYSGKNALDAPAVRAVFEFKKAITESEEAKNKTKP